MNKDILLNKNKRMQQDNMDILNIKNAEVDGLKS